MAIKTGVDSFTPVFHTMHCGIADGESDDENSKKKNHCVALLTNGRIRKL